MAHMHRSVWFPLETVTEEVMRLDKLTYAVAEGLAELSPPFLCGGVFT